MFGTVSFSNKKILTCAWVSLLLSSCSNHVKEGSGDCYYDTVETLAEVIELKPHKDGNGKIAVIMDFKASVLALEDQELGALKGFHIDHKFLTRNHIDLGNKYSVTVSELTKGDCDTKLTVAFDHGFQ